MHDFCDREEGVSEGIARITNTIRKKISNGVGQDKASGSPRHHRNLDIRLNHHGILNLANTGQPIYPSSLKQT